MEWFPTCSFTADAYHAITQGIVACQAFNTDFTDLAFETQMTIIKGIEGGIAFRFNTNMLGGYFFLINLEGSYHLSIFERDQGFTKILTSGMNKAIHPGLHQPNTITLLAQGNIFHLFVNNQLIDTTTDKESSFGHGTIGLFAGTGNKPTEVSFSNVKVWIPPS